MKFLLFFLVLATKLQAQQLVPYQVQDFKKWERKLLGYKDKNFNIIIQPINEAPNLFKNGYCVLENNNKMGLIDTKGNIIIQPLYEKCSNVEGDYVSLKDGFYSNERKNKPYAFNSSSKKTFFLEDETNPNIDFQFSGIDGILITRLYDKTNSSSSYGLKNINNEILLPNIYKEIEKIDDNILRVKTKDNLYGLVNTKTWILLPTYDRLYKFNDEVSLIQKGDKWGYIDKLGKEILPVVYDYADNFMNGYAGVRSKKDFSIINKAGQSIISSPILKKLLNAVNGYFLVEATNDSVYIININGKNQSIVANEIGTEDGKSFLLRVGKNVYSFVENILTKIPIENAVSIAAMKMGFFKINCKADNDEKETVTVFNLLGTVIANRENSFKYLEQEDLQLLEKYWEVKVPITNWEDEILHNVYSYISPTGKTYSDITK